MATIKQRLRRKEDDGSYNIIHLETSSGLVMRPGDKGTVEDNLTLLEGEYRSNPNLLDNWYLADPVNQRGQTVYSGNGYTIDRWVHATYRCTTTIGDGYMELAINNDVSAMGWTNQLLEDPQFFAGKTLTLSCLQDPSFSAFLPQVRANNSPTQLKKWGVNTPQLISGTWEVPNDVSTLSASLILSANSTGRAYAVKLELGDQQTLAHQELRSNYGDTLPAGVYDAGDGMVWVLNDPPPNKALELAKCQRYFQILRNVTTNDAAPVHTNEERDANSVNIERGKSILRL